MGQLFVKFHYPFSHLHKILYTILIWRDLSHSFLPMLFAFSFVPCFLLWLFITRSTLHAFPLITSRDRVLSFTTMTPEQPAASPFTFNLDANSQTNEGIRREHHPNMIDRSTQSKPKEVPTGPRSHFGPKHLVWRKQVNAADGKEEYVTCPASSFTHCSLQSSIMTADPRRAGQKRSAALDSPLSESSARNYPV